MHLLSGAKTMKLSTKFRILGPGLRAAAALILAILAASVPAGGPALASEEDRKSVV